MPGIKHAGVGLIFLAIASAWAGPMIQFDKTTFVAPLVIEGRTQSIQASFTVWNSGDKPLRISKVKPTCECTVVKFDSIVRPGQSTVINAVVTIDPFFTGELEKSLTVFSNARNAMRQQLWIKAPMRPFIGLSEQYITLFSPRKDSVFTLRVSSLKPDLEVFSVSFHPNPEGNTGKSALTPVKINFKWQATDSTNQYGDHIYALKLNFPLVKKEMTGAIVMTTNHPDKQEIGIPAGIPKPPQTR
ncbi:MAG: DUF1573 domain-containing protein [Chitinivibrionales bacterium]|nr:DUF1573 domain-containing protein [Chitinivibrionales bacterium]